MAAGSIATVHSARVLPSAPVTTGDINAAPIRYGRDIRPILSDRCFKCHGPDAAQRQAKLRLDDPQCAVADLGGRAAIVPGHPESSELWRRINEHNADELMPPPGAGKPPITPEQRDLIRRWIEGGAAYEPHWAFVAPTRPKPPDVREGSWVRNPIDSFILADLERQGVEPAPPAEPPTLVRRVFLDLTGLPPTPEETDAYLADGRPDAFERLVDRLMTEEPYRTRTAERLAAPWMDAARYADTCGIHMDAGRQMWLWRDWVLSAYRDNMPFDRFITEQLAGDLIPDATDSQKIASGFNRNHVTTDEGGAISEEYLVEYAVDRTATTGSVLLGLTMGCARCHDHKFDPITQADFYGMYAFFNSIEEPGLYTQEQDPQRAFEPFLVVPTAEQKQRRESLETALSALKSRIDEPSPEEDAQRAKFFADIPGEAGLAWQASSLVSAAATGGATLTPQPDGSLLASGPNPPKDDFDIVLRTDASNLRLISLEALTDPSLHNNSVGRADNGNAVLSGFTAVAVSIADPTRQTPVRFRWAWADHEQQNGDYRIVSAFRGGESRGWAVQGHERTDPRIAYFLAEEPFGFDGGTEIHIRLEFRSQYAQHTLGRVRLNLGQIKDEGLARLPIAASSWYLVGPFDAGKDGYDAVLGPEEGPGLDFERNFGAGNQFWRYAPNVVDERVVTSLPQGSNVTYLGRLLYSPTARRIDLSLGSDDGFKLIVNGKEAATRKVDRAAAADQDKASIDLVPGLNTIVFKIVNTGGIGGMYWKAVPEPQTLRGDLLLALAPEAARTPERTTRAALAWKLAFSERYRKISEEIAATQRAAMDVERSYPKTMVMKELATPRETFVLKRGEYDKPDKSRPVSRAVPAALGRLPEGAPANRLGLAAWMTSPDNPLVARVAANRLWELAFGAGIVRTTEDFGLQGEWPTHPELLDWLAVEYREGGWDTRKMLRLILTSSTYRQSSRVRPEVKARDPENLWLAYVPRKRLTAEQIRDQALYVSGLLAEKLGGPSVKPYQPEGLWQEVAMIQSNTRIYEPGKGDDLWRRSLYTYWKRALPPPSLMTFDAPTRESCTIRRISTNTPLQALVLWNDVQYVEAARALAERTLAAPGDDRQRLAGMFRRCTGRAPVTSELDAMLEALNAFRARFAAAPEDAAKLIGVGQSPRRTETPAPELAAWTVLGNAVLSLDETVTKG